MPLLLAVLVAVLILGLAIYAVQNYLPATPIFKNAVCFLLVCVFIVWLLSGVGWLPESKWH